MDLPIEKSSKNRNRSQSPSDKKRKKIEKSLSPLEKFSQNGHKKRDYSSSRSPKRRKKSRSYSRETDVAYDWTIKKEIEYKSTKRRDYSLDKQKILRRLVFFLFNGFLRSLL